MYALEPVTILFAVSQTVLVIVCAMIIQQLAAECLRDSKHLIPKGLLNAFVAFMLSISANAAVATLSTLFPTSAPMVSSVLTAFFAVRFLYQIRASKQHFEGLLHAQFLEQVLPKFSSVLYLELDLDGYFTSVVGNGLHFLTFGTGNRAKPVTEADLRGSLIRQWPDPSGKLYHAYSRALKGLESVVVTPPYEGHRFDFLHGKELDRPTTLNSNAMWYNHFVPVLDEGTVVRIAIFMINAQEVSSVTRAEILKEAQQIEKETLHKLDSMLRSHPTPAFAHDYTTHG